MPVIAAAAEAYHATRSTQHRSAVGAAAVVGLGLHAAVIAVQHEPALLAAAQGVAPKDAPHCSCVARAGLWVAGVPEAVPVTAEEDAPLWPHQSLCRVWAAYPPNTVPMVGVVHFAAAVERRGRIVRQGAVVAAWRRGAGVRHGQRGMVGVGGFGPGSVCDKEGCVVCVCESVNVVCMRSSECALYAHVCVHK